MLILLVVSVILASAQMLLVNYGDCKIVINKEKVFNVKGGYTLISYLISSRIFIPSACGGKATCGFCKVKVLSGAGNLLPTEEVFINKNEKAEGIRLACQVKVKNDIEIWFPKYLLSTKEYHTRVEEIKQLTHDIKQITLSLDPKQKVEFKPGQYIQIKVPGIDEYRAYSISSSPKQTDKIELIIRHVPGGLCSGYVHEVLNTGNYLDINGPFGEFYLQEDSERDIIFVGGGCGMAPIKSILSALIEKGVVRKAVYFFGARSKKDLFFTEELREIENKYPNFKYIPALSEPKASDKWDGETGMITYVMEKCIEDASNSEAYLCGPTPMIDASIRVLTKKGMNIGKIFYDKF
ncbi:MAG: 2Fe-2S iron-sulfur cluster binding domain-containing protein [Elusimicrobia bacterium]|nr:2Fe-2S iron-sulfur cluster binding domain-containing protein [Elusimicrobiota bacterium]